jgi:hypothetical protein
MILPGKNKYLTMFDLKNLVLTVFSINHKHLLSYQVFKIILKNKIILIKIMPYMNKLDIYFLINLVQNKLNQAK